MRSNLLIVFFAIALGCGAKADTDAPGSLGSECNAATGCNGNLVCSEDNTCVDVETTCADHLDCNLGTICSESGTCATNEAGGSCAHTANCVGGEICDDGVCFDAGSTGCLAPDLMVVLDRTGSMSERPDGSIAPNTTAGKEETKWAIAVGSIEAITATLDDSVRFGLALFPRDADDFGGLGDCSNLGSWLEGFNADPIGGYPDETNNPLCESSDLEVSPGLGNATVIDAALSVDESGLCFSTPIGSGLEVARAELETMASGDREQFALLITDGADNCDDDGGYTTDSLGTTDAMAAADVRTFVVGFDGSGIGVDEGHLNHLACAGGTAVNFETNCEDIGGSRFRSKAPASRSDDRLFLLAESASGLQAALDDIGSDICCGCGTVE